jgi:hypothetical protein
MHPGRDRLSWRVDKHKAAATTSRETAARPAPTRPTEASRPIATSAHAHAGTQRQRARARLHPRGSRHRRVPEWRLVRSQGHENRSKRPMLGTTEPSTRGARQKSRDHVPCKDARPGVARRGDRAWRNRSQLSCGRRWRATWTRSSGWSACTSRSSGASSAICSGTRPSPRTSRRRRSSTSTSVSRRSASAASSRAGSSGWRGMPGSMRFGAASDVTGSLGRSPSRRRRRHPRRGRRCRPRWRA